MCCWGSHLRYPWTCKSSGIISWCFYLPTSSFCEAFINLDWIWKGDEKRLDGVAAGRRRMRAGGDPNRYNCCPAKSFDTAKRHCKTRAIKINGRFKAQLWSECVISAWQILQFLYCKNENLFKKLFKSFVILLFLTSLHTNVKETYFLNSFFLQELFSTRLGVLMESRTCWDRRIRYQGSV